MPIPELNTQGLLPPGVHDCTIEEIAARFGVFQGSEHRPRLMEKLTAFIAEARMSGIACALLIDGSFVTATPAPNDIDLVVVLLATHDRTVELLPSQYNLVAKNRVRRRFGFDSLAVREGTVEYAAAVAFFQQVRRQPEMRKGILKLAL